MKKIILFIISLFTLLCAGFAVTAYTDLKYHLFAPKITVLMSTYNRAPFLPHSINSILKQTFTDFEFIIINDGSPDETDKILRLFAAKDKRIRVITNEQNKGLIYSLNLGLDKARGKYIARMDDDDIALPQRLEKQYAFMEQNPDFAVVASWIGRPDGKGVWHFQKETNPEALKVQLYLNSVPISHPASFLRRDFLNKNNIRYDPIYKAAEDRKFWLDIFDANGKMGNIPEVLLRFRLHQSNPHEYYINQWKNLNHFFNQEIRLRFGTTDEFKDLDKCATFRKFVEKNKTLKFVNQEELIRQVEEACPSGRTEKVHHQLWKDIFVFDNNRVCRHAKKDCASILSQTTDTLVIKWDLWGTETFIKKGDVWVLK